MTYEEKWNTLREIVNENSAKFFLMMHQEKGKKADTASGVYQAMSSILQSMEEIDKLDSDKHER